MIKRKDVVVILDSNCVTLKEERDASKTAFRKRLGREGEVDE